MKDIRQLKNGSSPNCVNKDADQTCALMYCFESLGGTGQGCEFGVVQRIFKAEPLGLLRWTHIEPFALAEALECSFDGVGTPEQTELSTFPQAHDDLEYFTRDRRFGMRMHTFLRQSDGNARDVLDRCCRRLQYLRQKLLEDLCQGDKIFVYKHGERTLLTEELDKLDSGIRKHGNGTLLYVCLEDPNHPDGMVESVRDGLLIGRICHFNVGMSGEHLRPLTKSWLKICSAALSITQTMIKEV